MDKIIFKLPPISEYWENKRYAQEMQEFEKVKEVMFKEESEFWRLSEIRERIISDLVEIEEFYITLREIGIYYTFVSEITKIINNQEKKMLEAIKDFEGVKNRPLK